MNADRAFELYVAIIQTPYIYTASFEECARMALVAEAAFETQRRARRKEAKRGASVHKSRRV